VQFFGQFAEPLDPRRRVSLPDAIADAIGETALRRGLVVTRGFDHCLYLFTAIGWESVGARFASVFLKGLEARMLERLFLGSAVDLPLGARRRFTLPPELCEQAGLTDQALFLGAAARIEIWNPQRWNALKHPALERYEELGEAFGRLVRNRTRSSRLTHPDTGRA